MRRQVTQKEVVTFLYNTAVQLKHGNGDVQALPSVLIKYASANQLPILVADQHQYYKQVQKQMLPKLSKTDPILHQVLQPFCAAHPPLYGGGSGSHVSYEMMHRNDDLIALTGTFIECWDIAQ